MAKGPRHSQGGQHGLHRVPHRRADPVHSRGGRRAGAARAGRMARPRLLRRRRRVGGAQAAELACSPVDEKVRDLSNLRRGGFTTENQPDHAARGEKQRAMSMVRTALQNAADRLGNEAMFLEMWRGNPAYSKLPPNLAAKLLAEDRRCFLNIYAKLLPVEVQGAIDTSLTVRVVTQLGGDVGLDVTKARPIPQDAAPLPALPAAE